MTSVASWRRCRVAADGALPHVQPAPSLSEQFGLHCAVVRQLTGGFPYKVGVLQRWAVLLLHLPAGHAVCMLAALNLLRTSATQAPTLPVFPLHQRPVPGA